MIKLTRLDDTKIYVNEIYIETIETMPDTKINLHNGTSYIIKEEADEVINLIKKWEKNNKKIR